MSAQALAAQRAQQTRAIALFRAYAAQRVAQSTK